MNSTQLNIRADKPFSTEKDKTMSNFDFSKAISGEPIYCNSEIIAPLFDPISQRFKWGDTVWNNKGVVVYGNPYDYLTTDPPRKKVKKTMYIKVFQHDFGKGLISSSSILSKEHAEGFQLSPHIKDLGVHKVEIEVEE